MGAQAGYTYLRPFRAAQKVQDILADFFKNISLPRVLPPEPGEVNEFEYGGYLKSGDGLSMGYEFDRRAILRHRPASNVGEVFIECH